MADQPATRCDRRREVEIEFLGGPFDGYRDRRQECPEHLPNELIWFVSQNAFRLLEGQAFGPNSPITSVALYERESAAEGFRYRFLGAVAMHDLSVFDSGR